MKITSIKIDGREFNVTDGTKLDVGPTVHVESKPWALDGITVKMEGPSPEEAKSLADLVAESVDNDLLREWREWLEANVDELSAQLRVPRDVLLGKGNPAP